MSLCNKLQNNEEKFIVFANVIEIGFQYLISMLATTQDQENFSQLYDEHSELLTVFRGSLV